MTDTHDDDGGDAPDTFDDRLAGIVRLIDTLADELDDARRLAHRAVILRLLSRLSADTLDRIAALFDRVGE